MKVRTSRVIYEEGIADGRAEGIAEGEARGEAIGMVKAKFDTLMQQLRKRFGKVPRRKQAQMKQASVADLDAWSLRVLDAPSLQAVFAD